MLAEYYYQTLYPLQDKAIEVFKGSPFYLTDGTVLCRVYYNHRFSDDLDDTEIKWIRPVPSGEIKKFLTDIAIKIVKGEL